MYGGTDMSRKRNVFHNYLQKLVCFVLAFMMCVAFLPTTVTEIFADSYVGEVEVTKNGSKTTKKFTDVTKLWDHATDQGSNQVVIWMYSDWTTSTSLTVKEKNNISIYMNGHMINRNLVNKDKGLHKADYGYGSGQVFYIKDNATVNIDGGADSSSKAIAHSGYINTAVNGGKVSSH